MDFAHGVQNYLFLLKYYSLPATVCPHYYNVASPEKFIEQVESAQQVQAYRARHLK